MSENGQHKFTILKAFTLAAIKSQLTNLLEDSLKGIINPLKRRE